MIAGSERGEEPAEVFVEYQRLGLLISILELPGISEQTAPAEVVAAVDAYEPWRYVTLRVDRRPAN